MPAKTNSAALKPAEKAALLAIYHVGPSVIGSFECPEPQAQRLVALGLLWVKPGRKPGRGLFGRWKHAVLMQAGKDAAEAMERGKS